MSEDKKPKKDLRARLGRTIAPNTPGAAPIAAPAGVIAPPAMAPASGPATRSAPPPAAPARMPFGTDIAPPPFARPAEPARPEPRRRAVDPFAAGPASSDQVRVVFDEKPTDDAATTRRANSRNMVLVSVGLVTGAVLGGFGGSANARNGLYNVTVRDGHDVHDTVEAASPVVLQAQQHIEAIAASASGGADHHPTVNYDEIAALVALENPLHAGAFARKNYNRFDPHTVDDLFTYDANVQEFWGLTGRFAHLHAITTGDARRAALDQTAAATVCPADLGHDDASANAAIQAANAATGDAASAHYVALLEAEVNDEDGTILSVSGNLGFAEAELDPTSHQPTDRVFVRASRSGSGRAFDRWTPATEIHATPTAVIDIDGPASEGVLGDRLGAFRAFAQSVEETRTLMRETVEVQQRLTTSLAGIANLQEAFSF